jgi:UDP-2,3-diacylglucosamine pyrophosphatase LpxH
MQSGAAGVGTLALGGPVRADQNDEHYVIASDFHLGSPFASEAKSRQFLDEEVPSLDPDVLVLAGDIYEMWWRGKLSSALDVGQFSAQLEQLHESGTDVVLVAGNHDRWLLEVGQDAADLIAPGEPWEVGEEFYFESGETAFVAVHGDEGDIIQRDPLSEWLCLQTDQFGTFLLEVLDLISGLGTVGEMGSASVAGEDWQSVSLTRQYDDPVVVPGPLGGAGLVRPRLRTGSSLLGTAGFEVRLEPWGDGTPASETVDFLAMERGYHEFGTDSAAAVDRLSADGDWQTVSFTEPFEQPPAVFTAVQGTGTSGGPVTGPSARRRRTRGRERAAGARARARGEDEFAVVGAPVSVQVRNVTEMGFDLRLAAETEPLPHEVGVVAIARGTAALGGGSVEVGVPGDTGGGELPVSFDSLPGDPDQMFAGPQSTTAAGPALTRLSVGGGGDASVSVLAGDGTPVSETVGYLAADGVGLVSASSSTALESDPDTVLQQEWETLLASDGPVPVGEAPEVSPTAGLLDPVFAGQQSTRENLLEMFDEFVVFGHTHRPDLGERYVNSGSWTNRSPDSVPQNTYVEIDQGDITVWDWSPGGREPVFES